MQPVGKKYDVEPLGSTTLMRMDELACACLDALDPRLGEQAVRKEFSLVVKRFTAEAFKQHQAFGVFGGVEAMQAGARAADMLERTEKK